MGNHMQDIREALDNLGEENDKYYELSVAMAASPAMMAKIEYDKVLEIVDFANMMTYDLNGAWNGYTGHQTALYTNDSYNPETQKDGQFSIDTCISYLEDTYGNNIDYSKIVVGVAPYTRGWAQVKNDGPDKENPGLYATAAPNSVKAADGTTSGTFAYGEIDSLISKYQLKEYYDEKAEAAYYYSADTGYFFTCDNERSVAAKGNYVKQKKLGGLISWMASLDSANALTKTMHDSLYGDEKLPTQEIKTANPKVTANITASEKQYTIELKNIETQIEKNTALKDADVSDIESITMTRRILTSLDEFGTQVVYGAGSGQVPDITTNNQEIQTTLSQGESTNYGGTERPTKDVEVTTKHTETTAGEVTAYPEWKVGNSYSVGDLVYYKGTVYECIFPHVSQSDWAPGTVASLWKATDLRGEVQTTSGQSQTTGEIVTEQETTELPTTEIPTTKEPETEETTKPEIIISNQVKVEGYQISTTLGGIRALGSVGSKINGKKVKSWGFVYVLEQNGTTKYPVTEKDMYVGSDNNFVAAMESTEKGTLEVKEQGTMTTTCFVRTMLFKHYTKEEFNAVYKIRTYAQLEDNTYVYSNIYSYSVAGISDNLYQNKKMSNQTAHDYLYNKILKMVNPSYQEVDYNWQNEIVKPDYK